jgi:hypothetical protein
MQETMKFLPHNARRPTIFNPQTWQELDLRKAFWEIPSGASRRLKKASVDLPVGSAGAAAMVVFIFFYVQCCTRNKPD